MIRKDIKTRALASGAALTIPVFHFKGSQSNAPSLYLQSSVHAAEAQGYLVALLLIEHFAKNPPKGEVTIVPLANPYGADCKAGEYTAGRFDPVTGDNWNRNYLDLSYKFEKFLQNNKDKIFAEIISLFKQLMQDNIKAELQKPIAYHKKLALELQQLAVTADIVLDLHCDTISKPHIYSAKYALDSATKLGIEYIIEIPAKFAGALDEASFCPWLALYQQYNKSNPPFEAFTIELGSQEQINVDDAKAQVESILGYLNEKGVIAESDFKVKEFSGFICKLEDFLSVYAPVGGLILESVALGKKIQAGESLVVISNPAKFDGLKDLKNIVHQSSKSISIDKDAIVITKTCTANVHEGMVLMKVMTNL